MGRHRAFAALAFLLALGPAAAQEREARMAFLGDSGSGGDSQREVRDQLLRFPSSLVFLLGDNIYDRGERRLIAPRFDDVYQPVMRRGARFHATLGNHDVKFCSVAYRDPLPAGAEAYHWSVLRCDVRHHLEHAPFGYLGGHRYYSVVSDASAAPLGEVFVLDSNTLRGSQTKLLPLQEDRAQLAWLEGALGRSRARWKIAIMHHPMHSPPVPGRTFFFIPIGDGRAREIQLERQLAPIFKRHALDVVFAGHNHFYARMRPQDGIRYFVSGGGGRGVYSFNEDPEYVAAGGGFYHFVHVRLTNGRFEYYAIDEDGVSRDAGWWAKGDAADRPLPVGTLPPRLP